MTIDRPVVLKNGRPLALIFYALPNGKFQMEWTMGKLKKEGDDWHYDIQHIR